VPVRTGTRLLHPGVPWVLPHQLSRLESKALLAGVDPDVLHDWLRCARSARWGDRSAGVGARASAPPAAGHKGHRTALKSPHEPSPTPTVGGVVSAQPYGFPRNQAVSASTLG
jgi:hypothetical protein